jgi:hypothetical protein
MQQATQDGHIPQECFAKKHSQCNHAVLTKQVFCDSSWSLHHPAGLGECNFGDCYDRTAHPPTSIALQSWGIPKIIHANNAICTKDRFQEISRKLQWNQLEPQLWPRTRQRSLPTSVFGIELIDCQCLPLFGSWCQDMFLLCWPPVLS